MRRLKNPSSSTAESEAAAFEEIVAPERAALDLWYGKSDPATFVELFADQVTYFDVWSAGKLEDDDAKNHVLAFAGQIPDFRYEIVDPTVDLYGDTAVLAFNVETFDRADGNLTSRWNTTHVYHRVDDGWERVHAHWSSAEPES